MVESGRLDTRQPAYRTLEKDRLALLIEAGKSLTGALEVEEVLARIMNHLFQILPVKRAAIALIEPDGTLKPRLVRPEAEHHELSSACSQHIIQKVLDSQTPAIIDDAAADDALAGAQSIVQSNIRAAICAPLSAQTRVLGALYADYPGRARLYRQSDLDFFGAFAGIAAVALENARLQRVARDRARLQRDLEIAGEIQLGLLPDDSFAHPGIEIDWTYRPSKQVGGDFYDCMTVGDGRLAMVLGDVSGKSIAAALFMARTMSFLRSLLREDPAPSLVLTECNKLLGSRTDRVMFATACYLLVDLASQEGRFASAGHNPVPSSSLPQGSSASAAPRARLSGSRRIRPTPRSRSRYREARSRSSTPTASSRPATRTASSSGCRRSRTSSGSTPAGPRTS
jgi:hypothetical protein